MTDGNVQAVACVGHRPVFGMHGDFVAPRKNQQLDEFGSSRRIQRHKLFMLTHGGVLRRWNPDVSSNAGVLGVWALAAGPRQPVRRRRLHRRARRRAAALRDPAAPLS